jgi:hypothetical protein
MYISPTNGAKAIQYCSGPLRVFISCAVRMKAWEYVARSDSFYTEFEMTLLLLVRISTARCRLSRIYRTEYTLLHKVDDSFCLQLHTFLWNLPVSILWRSSVRFWNCFMLSGRVISMGTSQGRGRAYQFIISLVAMKFFWRQLCTWYCCELCNWKPSGILPILSLRQTAIIMGWRHSYNHGIKISEWFSNAGASNIRPHVGFLTICLCL